MTETTNLKLQTLIIGVALFAISAALVWAIATTNQSTCVDAVPSDDLTQGYCDNQIATAVAANATAIQDTRVARQMDRAIPDNNETAVAVIDNIWATADAILATAIAWSEHFQELDFQATQTAEAELTPVVVPTETPVSEVSTWGTT